MADKFIPAQSSFNMLMERIKSRDETLHLQLQAVVDAGKDIIKFYVDENKKRRTYRETVPYTIEEAIEAVLKCLESYFVEQPLLANSSLEDMQKTVLGEPRKGKTFDGDFPPEVNQGSFGQEKTIDYEVGFSTRLTHRGETFRVKRLELSSIAEQRLNLTHLRKLLGVEENDDNVA